MIDDPLPVAKIPQRGQMSCNLSMRKAKYGLDLIAQVRSLEFNFLKLAGIVGARIPPDVTVEQASQMIEEMSSAIVWMRLTRQLRAAGYDLLALFVQSQTAPIMDSDRPLEPEDPPHA